MSGNGERERRGPIPPRWRKCPPMGNVLANTQFIPFKTPLDPKYDEYLPGPSFYFHLDTLFDTCKQNNVELGMIIDLTKTDRYYNKEEVEQRGCRHVKIKCEGHGECPDDAAWIKFKSVCSNFWKQTPNKYIGVHCTHGFNRTGYLICRYLYDAMDMAIEDAVFLFAQARPSGIYKDDYLEELYKTCDGDVTEIDPPGRPDWEDESDLDGYAEEQGDEQAEGGEGEGGTEGGEEGDGSRKRGIDEVEEEPQNVEGVEYETVNGRKRVKYMVGLPFKCGEHVDGEELWELQDWVASMTGWGSRKRQFPGSQPVSLDQQNLKLLHQEPFMVSWKADGTRYMMLIRKDGTYMIDRDNNVFRLPWMDFPRKTNLHQRLNHTLVDGELVVDEDKKTHQKTCRYLIYDIIAFETHMVGQQLAFTDRLHLATKEIIKPRKEAEQQRIISTQDDPFRVRVKEFFPIQDTVKVVQKIMPTLPHETDGLVLTPVQPPYVAGRFRKLLKWKPPHQNSVDFLYKMTDVGGKVEGSISQKMPLLYVLHEQQPVGTMDVSSLAPHNIRAKDLDGKIVECTLGDPKQRTWRFMRIRTDKSHPNSIKTFQGVFTSIVKGVTQKQLLEFIPNHAIPVNIQRKYNVIPQRDEDVVEGA